MIFFDGIFGNRAMMIVIAAFAVTVIMVYLIRRLSVDYAWTIAVVAGALLDVVILMVGDLMYDANFSIGGVILGSLGGYRHGHGGAVFQIQSGLFQDGKSTV